MAIRKFLARNGYRPHITQVDVDRETESSVFVNGKRRAKLTDYESYFDTFEEAKAHLISAYELEVKKARLRLEHANSGLGNAKGLKPPPTP